MIKDDIVFISFFLKNKELIKLSKHNLAYCQMVLGKYFLKVLSNLIVEHLGRAVKANTSLKI